jgi:hypothetical protein
VLRELVLLGLMLALGVGLVLLAAVAISAWRGR